MAMMEILDSVRSIIVKWVNTTTRISADIAANSNIIYVAFARRFQVGDQVFITDNSVYETNKIIEKIDYDNNVIKFSTPVLNNWSSSNAVMIKAIHENIVQGVYIGDPDVISHYPAITVNGTSRSSEWMTLRSTKERYEIEIGIYVKASSLEKGYRFLMQITDIIQHGLKSNIIPLVNDMEITSLTEDAHRGDVNIKIADTSLLNQYRRIILESDYEWEEKWVSTVHGDGTTIGLRESLGNDFSQSKTSVIVPHRFIFNSWPAQIEYGKIHKGELLKASVIRWFAEEEEIQFYQGYEPNLK